MSRTFKPITTRGEWEHLADKIGRANKPTKTLTVSRDALQHLFADQVQAIGRLRELGVDLEETE